MFGKLKKYYCPVCTNKIKKLAPLPSYYLERYGKFGYKYLNDCKMTVIPTHSYPVCKASDRERLAAFFLSSEAKLSSEDKIAHFAPEPALYSFLKEKLKIKPLTIDLFMESADLKADLTKLDTLENDSFNGFICSHVLEHIEEDSKALSELYRILKLGGWGILMAPICLSIDKTLEDKSVTSIEDRWRLYGQDDHVRLYSKQGFLDKISQAGFSIRQIDNKVIGEKNFQKMGLKDTSVLYVLGKNK